jgi:hypothetical protein
MTEVRDVTGTVTLRASAGTCSARCWVSDFDGYDRGLLDRLDRDCLAAGVIERRPIRR